MSSAPSAGARADACAPPRLKNTVRLEPLGSQGLMGVPITLNGVEKKFLFDTGGAGITISSAVATELKLAQFGSVPMLDMRGNRSDSAVLVEHVRLGGIEAGFVRFQVAPDLAFAGILPARALGRNVRVFSEDDLDMDFGAMTLKFFSSDHCEGGVVTWPHQALAVVPVSTAYGHIELPVTLDGHPLTAAIDTGAPWTVLNLTRAQDKLGFSPDSGPPQPPGLPKDDPARQFYVRKFSALSLEGITIANPVMIVRPLHLGGKDDPRQLGTAQHESDFANRHAPDIIIGMEILRHLHIYYAAEEQTLYVTPANS